MPPLVPVAPSMDDARAVWRMTLVQAHALYDWPLALAVLEQMRRAGVDILDTAEEAAQADEVIDKLGQPARLDGFAAFADGYDRASKDFHHEGATEAERDGADAYRSVYHALDWALGKYTDRLRSHVDRDTDRSWVAS